MKEPTLVILAAGMGSRYGGLKQIDPVDEDGHIIIDYSLYDARRAGFKKVAFITKEADKEAFDEAIANRMREYFDVTIALQDMNNLPEGYSVPDGRTKPWGTSHALLSCRGLVDGPVAVINADDYYGIDAFKQIYEYLTTHEDGDKLCYSMVGYQLKNTVTDNGHVARGVCQTKDGYLTGITERTMIAKRDLGIAYSEDGGESWTDLDPDTVVSMNLWGFTNSIFDETARLFPKFLDENLEKNPMKCEYFIPLTVDNLLSEEKASVEVLTSKDRWYGVTYKEDKPSVEEAFKRMRQEGLYPKHLWE